MLVRVELLRSPFFCGISTGTVSQAKNPAACAAAVMRCCERIANASWSARWLICNPRQRSQRFPASNRRRIWPFIAALTNRQPMVVSKISALRLNAASALPMSRKARATCFQRPAHDHARSASPALIAREATLKASRLDPHRRLIVEL